MRMVRYLLLMIVGVYLILITAHYFNQRPLWLDEGCIERSVVQLRGLVMFQEPLAQGQQFPRLYLWLIQGVTIIFGKSVLTLRLLPFLAMTIAFVLWVRIYYVRLKENMFLLLALMCWVASMPMIYYAAELKQYSMDVLVAAIYITFAINQARWLATHPRVYYVTFFLLPFLWLFSYIAVLFFVIPWINHYLLMSQRRWATLFLYSLICVGVLALIYFFDIRISSAGALRKYWQDYFINFDNPSEFLKSFGESMNNFIAHWFARKPKWISMGSRLWVGLGLVYLLIIFKRQWQNDRWQLVRLMPIGGIVFLELCALSILHIYPFSVVRMVLFFVPILFAAMAEGLQWLWPRQRLCAQIMYFSLLAFLLIVSFGIGLTIFGGDLGAESDLFMVHK